MCAALSDLRGEQRETDIYIDRVLRAHTCNCGGGGGLRNKALSLSISSNFAKLLGKADAGRLLIILALWAHYVISVGRKSPLFCRKFNEILRSQLLNFARRFRSHTRVNGSISNGKDFINKKWGIYALVRKGDFAWATQKHVTTFGAPNPCWCIRQHPNVFHAGISSHFTIRF